MSMSFMPSRKATLFILVAASGIAFPFVGKAVEEEEKSTTVEVRIRELHAERVKLLESRWEQINSGYAEGSPSYDKVINAEYDLLNAKLKQAVGKRDRFQALEAIIENRRSMEAYQKAMFQQGTGQMDAVLAASAKVLEAQIALYEELLPNATLTLGE